MLGRNIFVHQLVVPAFLGASVSGLTLRASEEFAVVAGYSTQAQDSLVLPKASDNTYLVPCGAAGLPFVPDLGASGTAVKFDFPRQIVAVVVATYSAVPPVLDFVYIPLNTGGYLDGENLGKYSIYMLNVDNSRNYQMTAAEPKTFAEMVATFPLGEPFKGVNGYPGFTGVQIENL